MIMKMKAWKKVMMFAAALVLALALALLTGCSKPDAGEPAPAAGPVGVTYETSSDITIDLSGGAGDEVRSEEVPAAEAPAE
ncbi:MAG: hypothetical protein LBN12_01160 [Clostridiales Family XIII bacterium]|jgi:uncharacterized lipoprotein YajG|nr:hypothetical protein [Clostridiales Family XIII bacterium]